MRNRFDAEISDLKLELIKMASLIEKAISMAITSLIEKDTKKAKEVILLDEEINNYERDIERGCLKLLLQQQPVARDLRIISTALKMITDMERIGDHASDISEIVLKLNTQDTQKIEHIQKMAEEAKKMLNKAVDSFVKFDVVLAEEAIENDNIVDELFLTVRDEIVALIQKDSKYGEQATDYLMIAKYLERIGDHAQNIGEWVVFCVTGEHKNERII